ncbi:MAG: helix-turn-helix domain-containing protein [Alphaproteobacteria bacterium]|nr:helix-turn-helix domain-containing protein [Alphaproteobacteria bacterium]
MFPTAGSDVAVGDLLRTERQRRGWTLADAEIYLKIRRTMLEAIEQGRYEMLPGKAYALAFCRTYAEFLGLDSEDIVRRCRDELRRVGEPKAKPSAGMAGFSFDLPRILMTGAAAAGVIVAGMWMFGGGEPADLRSETARQQILPAREPGAAEAPRATAAAGGVGANSAGPGSALATPAAPGAIAAQAAPSPATSADPLAALAAAPPASGQLQSAQVPAVARAAAPAPVPVPAGPRITIRANGDTWVEIRDAAGASVLARTLRSGETYQVPDRSGLVLTSGRMNTLEVRVDGQVVPPQARPARRELQLDPARLLQNAQAPADAPAGNRAQPPRRGAAPAGGAAPAPGGTSN